MNYPNQPNRPARGSPPPQRPPKRRRSRQPRPQRRYPTPPPGSAAGPDYRQAAQSRPHPPRKRGRRGMAIGPGCIFGCMGLVAVMVLGFLITIWLIYAYYSSQIEDEVDQLEALSDYSSFETTLIYDRHGNELYEVLGEGRRTRISLDQVPQHLIHATIAVEDDTFYENRGIDIPSILRAATQYVQHGYIVSGGSTITQQLIRNVLFTEEYKNEKTLNRKWKEALLAVSLTQRMSKNEILELYLNEIYYGNLAYGIEAAAQTYFGKPAAALTLGEAALLAGLPQAPADLDPLNPDPDVQRRVSERRKLVLDLMVEEKYITQAEANAAYADPLNYIELDIELDSAPHFVVYAQAELEDLLVRELGLSQEDMKKMIAGGGLRIYTTIDMGYQHLAEDVARQQVAQLSASNHLTNAAVVVLRPDTGEILAMVGSVNYGDETIDGNVNVTIAARQPGSAMKPFTYAAAMEKGWTAATVIWDTETHIGIPGQPTYSPVNYDGQVHGPVRMRDALANSYNIAAVQTLRQVGVDYLLWMMNRVGVQSLSNDPSQYGLSLTLGGGEVTPLELTNAYAVLANGGLYIPSTPIQCVTNSKNEILYEYERRCPSTAILTGQSRSVVADARQVLDPRIAFVISHILADNNARSPAMGANSPLYTPGLPTSVKTGTTNDFRDNWTVGTTRNIAVGVWAGNTDNTPMQNVSGLQGAAPIWNNVMTGIYNNPTLLDVLGSRLPDDAHLQPPGGVVSSQICEVSRTALRDPATDCSPSVTEWFLDGPAAVPNNEGQLIAPAPSPVPVPSVNGPQPVEVQPSLIRIAVFPVTTEVANAIAALDSTGHTVPPRYCQVPIEVANMVPGVQEQLFIAPPPIEDDAFYARLWAQASGVAILPQYICNEQMLQAAPAAAGSSVPGVVAEIVSPTPGSVFTIAQQVDIVGSAYYTPEQASYFKVEIKGGPFDDYVTVYDIHTNPVANGLLESFAPNGLVPANYVLRVIVVGLDGNYAAVSNEIPFTVTQ
ncbi:MAG: transglycosylase domain-containing protein [Anaerolineae bacterium]|nr:transglycosylase domain-containing protein [Anaerolineae bacterium]